ncbi:MAG: c-type cytochrome [Bacillaceae bacterium]|nr:c-type cytochrome [Bacillaceae bacterium]
MIVTALALLVVSGCGAANDQADDQPADENDQQTEQPADNGEADGGEADGDAAEGGDETVDADFDAAAAEQAYQANCLACHGAELEGTVGPGLTDVGARLSQDEIYNIIVNGQGQMPAQAQLSEDEAQNMAAWLAAKK